MNNFLCVVLSISLLLLAGCAGSTSHPLPVLDTYEIFVRNVSTGGAHAVDWDSLPADKRASEIEPLFEKARNNANTHLAIATVSQARQQQILADLQQAYQRAGGKSGSNVIPLYENGSNFEFSVAHAQS